MIICLFFTIFNRNKVLIYEKYFLLIFLSQK